MDIKEILEEAIEKKASDILLVAGCGVAFKINNDVVEQDWGTLMPPETRKLIGEIYGLAGRDLERLDQEGDDDFSFSISEIGRFRCSTYKQRGSFAAVLRVVSFDLPDADEMQIPSSVTELYR